MEPQDQTVYEKYKNLVYRYLRKIYPEAEKVVQRRIMKNVWRRAVRTGLFSGTEEEREVLTALLALTEQEAHRARMQENWKQALQRRVQETEPEDPAEGA